MAEKENIASFGSWSIDMTRIEAVEYGYKSVDAAGGAPTKVYAPNIHLFLLSGREIVISGDQVEPIEKALAEWGWGATRRPLPTS